MPEPTASSRQEEEPDEPEEPEDPEDPEELLEDEVDADDDAGVDEEDEAADDAEDFAAPESGVLDLASEEVVLVAGFSASIAFFLDSDG